MTSNKSPYVTWRDSWKMFSESRNVLTEGRNKEPCLLALSLTMCEDQGPRGSALPGSLSEVNTTTIIRKIVEVGTNCLYQECPVCHACSCTRGKPRPLTRYYYWVLMVRGTSSVSWNFLERKVSLLSQIKSLLIFKSKGVKSIIN